MLEAGEIVGRARALFGTRLRGVFAFGSRVAGTPRPDSDLDVAVWLDGPLRRATTWVPWSAAFADAEPPIDPTFLTDTSLTVPPSWLLEAVRSGTAIWHDPSGALDRHLDRIRTEVRDGTFRRRLFMGLPYYERAAP
jgi:hypothetical protein